MEILHIVPCKSNKANYVNKLLLSYWIYNFFKKYFLILESKPQKAVVLHRVFLNKLILLGFFLLVGDGLNFEVKKLFYQKCPSVTVYVQIHVVF